MDHRPGCLLGLLRIGILNSIYNWLQRTIGWKSGSCLGCGCGFFLFIIFVFILMSFIFNTRWFDLVQAFPVI
ncbi:MAG: hypothetical protein HY835_02060 [Anaerolineae bacterium]|nr:hypothetical protein [Anaerolineae bacterium]